MDKINVFVPRARFNSKLPVHKFLTTRIVRLEYFKTFGEFITPLKFKISIDKNEETEEHIVELNFNKENNSYFQHYLGLKIDCLNTKLSVTALTDEVEEKKDTVSFSISFESYNDDGSRNRKPTIIPISKINSNSLQLV